MKTIRGIELKQGTYEELLPDFSPDFPYTASRVELDRYIGRRSPWHWHQEAELFYMAEGSLEYDTPRGKALFPAGSGGFVNSNVLHMSRAADASGPVTAYLHLFNPLLISGHSGSAIDQKFVTPLVTSPGAEIIGLYPETKEHAGMLDLLKRSFALSEEEPAYELRLRSVLSKMWFMLLNIAKESAGAGMKDAPAAGQASEKLKMMMVFLHRHYAEKITVSQVAAAAFISERECFRIFREGLNMTPVEYLTSYRLQRACYMLAGSSEPVTAIGQACGLGSSSYFGKVFREFTGCSPMQFRAGWRNNDINRR